MKLTLPSGFGFGGHIQSTLSGLQPISEPLVSTFGGEAGSPEDLMLKALMVSMRGAGETIPNPAVGCLMANGATVVSVGATEAYGGRHAERVVFEAMHKSGQSTSGLNCFVTLEPCSHHGKQPPCCELFQNSRISTLFTAITDPNPLVNGRGLKFITNQQIAVETNLGRAKIAATAWLLPFLLQQTLKRPLIAAKWAQTLDGALADYKGASQWITGGEARAHGHWLRLKYDVTAVGLNTLLADKPALTVRDCWRPNGRQPHACIIDPSGKADPNDPQFQIALEKLISAAPTRKVALLCPHDHHRNLQNQIPHEVSLLGFERPKQNENLGALIRNAWIAPENQHWLGRQPQSIYVEGGATLISLLVAADALDVLHVFTAPLLLGGSAQRVGCGPHKFPNLSMAAHFDILSTTLLGNDMLLELVPRRIVDLFFARG